MATITSKIVRGTSDGDLNSIDYAKYVWTETGLGANTFTVDKNTVSATLNLTGLTGDVINVGGYSGDYTAQLTNSILTLQNSDQTISVSLAKNSIITLNFSDGPKEVNLKYKTLGDQSLVTKTGVLHINGATLHEKSTLESIVKTTLTDAAGKVYSSVDQAITSDNALVIAKATTAALTNKTVTPNLIYNDLADVIRQTLTDTTVKPNITYNSLQSAITSNDTTVINDAIKSVTGYADLKTFTDAYNKLINPLPTFSVMGNSTVTEGDTATFSVLLANQGNAGDFSYSISTSLTPTGGATPGVDYVNTLTIDAASKSAGVTLDQNGKLTIPSSAKISIVTLTTPITLDTDNELTDGLNFTLLAPPSANALLSTNKTVITAIKDSQLLPTFSVNSSAPIVSEGDTVNFSVNLVNRSTGDYSVVTRLVGTGTGVTLATAGSDYTALTQLSLDEASKTAGVTLGADGVLKIPDSPAAKLISKVTLSVPVKIDISTETGEGLSLSLSEPTGTNVQLGTSISNVSITDQTFSLFSVTGNTTVAEGTNATFVVNLTNKPVKGDSSVTIKLEGTGSSATKATEGIDFTPLTQLSLDDASKTAGVTLSPEGVLKIPESAKSISKVTFSVPVNKDILTETGEGLSLKLSNPTGTNVILDLNLNNQVANTSIIDVAAPTFSVTGSTSVLEGSKANYVVDLANRPATGEYSVIVSLEGTGLTYETKANYVPQTTPAPTSAALDFGTNNISTATTPAFLSLDSASIAAGIKLENLALDKKSGNITAKLTIPDTSGITNVTLSTPVTADLLLSEANEKIRFTLSEPTGLYAVLNSNQSIVDTAITDVLPPTFTVTAPSSVDEGSNAIFTVNLANRISGSDYIVNVELAGTGGATIGTASDSSDLNKDLFALDSTSLAAGIQLVPKYTAATAATANAAAKPATLTGVLTVPASSSVTDVKISIPVKSDLFTPETGEGLKLILSPDVSVANYPLQGKNYIIDSITSVAPINIRDSSSNVFTTGADNILTTAGSFTFNATGLTLNAGDTVDGSASSNDVLNLTTDRNIPAVTITSIETINLTVLNAITVDMKPTGGTTSLMGVNTLNIKNSTGAVALTNVPDSTMAIGLSGSNTNTVTVGYLAATATALALPANNNDKFKVNLDSATDASIAVSTTGFDSTEVNVTNSSSLKLIDVAVAPLAPLDPRPPITISGSGALTIGADALRGFTDLYITDTAPIKIGQISATATAPVIATPLKVLNALSAGPITTDNIAGSTLGITALFNSNSDIITITSGATGTSINTIKLGAGSDTLNFTSIATGTSYLFGEADNDIINVASGAATTYIDGGAGNDTITSGSGTNNTISGGDGADTFTSSGTDTITDFILTGTGADTLTINSSGSARVYPYLASTGGTLSFSAINNSGTLRIDGSTTYGGVPITGSEIITGSTGIDNITGGTGNDLLDGRAGSDTMNGGAGNDTIIGGQGSDSLYGGTGDDTFITSSILFTADTIDGDDGTDTLSFTDTDSSITFSTANSSNVTDIEKIITAANALAINITVDNTNPVGLTTIDLSGDTNALGTNVVSSTGANGLTTIIGSAGIDQITLGTSAPATTITGGSGADTFTINNASNTVVTITDFVPNTDTLSIVSPTTVRVYSSTVATGTSGISYVSVSNSGKLYIDGATLSDGITTVTGAQTIIGSATGSNSIVGGSGSDQITGGALTDTLNGGNGDDVFQYSSDTLFIDGSNAVIDSIDGGAGIADSILFTATAAGITLVDTTSRITNVEKITTVANSSQISIIFTQALTGGFTTIDLSGDTNATGTNVVSSSGNNGISTIIGSAGIDAITLGAAAPATTITGGLGADTLALASGTTATVSDVDGIAVTITTGATLTTIGALVATSITGGTGVDTITLAGAVSNVATITGGTGLDVINLGASHTGGVKVNLAAVAADADTITNFVVGTDKIVLTKAVFANLAGTTGAVTLGTDFASTTTAAMTGAAIATATNAEHVVFDQTTNKLYYNSDGPTAGGFTEIATLVGVTTGLAATDFIIA